MTQNNSNSNNKKLFYTDNGPSIRNTPADSIKMENFCTYKDPYGTTSDYYESEGKIYFKDSSGLYSYSKEANFTASQQEDLALFGANFVPGAKFPVTGYSLFKSIRDHGVIKGITETASGELFGYLSKSPIAKQIYNYLGSKIGGKAIDALNNFNFKASQSVPKTMEYNPTTLKYGMTDFSNSQQPSSKAWEDFLNSAKGSETTKFSKLEPAKYDLSNNPIAGVANNTGSADTTQMLVSYPVPTVSTGGSNWLSSLSSIFTGVANIISLGASAVNSVNSIENAAAYKIYSPYKGEPTFENPAGVSIMHHTGGIVVPKYKGGRNEMMAILQGGETVRTEAQENELQDSKKKDILDAIAPLVSGDDKDDPYAQVFGNKNSKQTNSKIPVLLNKTRTDEEMIISIVAEAWRTNRSGFRNALRYS